jgi:hypothetical protein
MRIESQFGKIAVLVTDGHIPSPHGREITEYEVSELSDTISKDTAAGVSVVVSPYKTVAEIHSPISK